MINFRTAEGTFNFRIAGVCNTGDKVLLHRIDGDAMWILPGGRPELHETSHQALIREFREEAGEDIEIIRPLWTVENFFREGLADLPEHHRHIITADGD